MKILREMMGVLVLSAGLALVGMTAFAAHHEQGENPCAANPCASNPCAANPCNPCAANPCNPCNPCAPKNPCKNPCKPM